MFLLLSHRGHELLKRLFRYTWFCIIIFYSPKIYGWVKIYVVAASVPFSRLKIVTEYENIQIDFRSELDMFSEFRVSNFRASPWFHNLRPCKFHAWIFLIFYGGMSYVWHRPLPHLLALSIYLFLPYFTRPVTSGLDKELRKKITKDLRFPYLCHFRVSKT